MCILFLWQHSLAPWIAASLQHGTVGIGFPRFPLSSVTLVMILGASMLEDFTLTMIFYDTQNILRYSKIYVNFSLSLPRSLCHLILILKSSNNPMNHIYQTSLKMVSDSSRKSISFRDTLLPLKI